MMQFSDDTSEQGRAQLRGRSLNTPVTLVPADICK